ncbi:HlyD family efflux transporter periplasmic adaptor subunit [Barnesiella sp. WM24]|uniref:efflux RND transporter periplasmic adaptor subunit n=1 Tax=Barnesiella sp. WM24 TaxID=2558278 RepID=UPI0010722751|nr:HlyD family efflux transporter periplasmic adaptor subunit [Barnesiella sp. WM24]TFU95247.1 HlyD family efflux transporter periplasmic adaptor subunit [Barnesiella sp. WM24]
MDREIPKEELRRMKRKKIITTVSVVAMLAVVIAVIMMLTRTGVSRKDIVVATVDRGTIQSSVSAGGKVAPAFEEIINSPIATRIVEVYSKAGDSVDVGTPLMRLDLQTAETELNKLMDQIEMRRHELEQQRVNNATQLSDLEMQIKVKAMTVDRMAVELRNERYLDSLGSGTGDRVKQVELEYNTGKLELEQMRLRLANERKVTDANLRLKELELNITGKNLGEMQRTLDDARIRAPRKATLTYINDQVGQKIAEGERIAIISDLSHFKVDGEIADTYSDRVSVGADAIVKIGKERLPGKVSNVTPLSRNGVMAFTVRLDDDSNKRLRSGLKTDVYVMCDVIEDVVRITNGPFYTGPGEYELFVLDGDDELLRRKVTLGDSNFEYVEVKSGLQPGDRVVISDMKEFKTKKRLRIK